jgi:phage-related protein
MYQLWYTTCVDRALKRLPARFYRSKTGREPVREWLRRLESDEKKALGEDIKDVEFSWPIGLPLVRSLGRELWEIRSNLPRRRIARVLFCVEGGAMVLLHGFIKKTQKTPQQEIDLALKRKKGGGA